MGYLEDMDKKEIKDKAINIIKKCARSQMSVIDSDEKVTIMTIAKTWAEIYEIFDK